jgi:amyloid beta precursor protein binding protein 1
MCIWIAIRMIIANPPRPDQPVSSVISNANFLEPYSLILVSAPIDPDVLTTISAHAAKTATPLVYMHCVGFYAHFSIALPPAWPIVDTHPDPVSTTDLRLVKPWPALLEFVESKTKGLETMENDDHGHVPYLLLLVYYLEEWKKAQDGRVPSTYKEKQEFRDMVRAGMRTDTPEGSEENYEEAISAVLKSLNEPTAGSAVREIWDADECRNLTHEVRRCQDAFNEELMLICVRSPIISGLFRPPFPNSIRRTKCSLSPAQCPT